LIACLLKVFKSFAVPCQRRHIGYDLIDRSQASRNYNSVAFSALIASSLYKTLQPAVSTSVQIVWFFLVKLVMFCHWHILNLANKGFHIDL